MKITLRIPTADQYAFAEIVFEDAELKNGFGPESLKEEYDKYIRAFKVNEGLSPKEWNAALDEYLSTNNLKDGVNLYQLMSPTQQQCFQEIKKSLKRIVKE